MKRVSILTILIAATFAANSNYVFSADAAPDRVLAIYFHRTERCPTCKKMGAYADEAVKKGFSKQVKTGLVKFHFIDFQDKKNAAIKKAYNVKGPSLVIVKVAGKKVKKYQDLEGIWEKVHDKELFTKYVQDNVASYLK